MQDFTSTFGNSAANALPEQRAQFIRRTYMLLAATIAAFIVVEAALFVTGAAYVFTSFVFSGSRMTWLLVGLSALLFQRIVEVWITLSVPSYGRNSGVMTPLNFIAALASFSWALAVGGLICILVAALKSDAAQSTGVMPNTSLERTLER